MKKIKGFTLIELIIVMAILAILMAAIMRMFKPIRETYVDSTLYESQRTSQNGMVQYIAESIRYSVDLGLYTKGKVTNVEGAVEAFAKQYCYENGFTGAGPTYTPNAPYTAADVNKVKDEIKKYAEVIIIDHKEAYTFNNEGYTGRILRRKFIDDGSGGYKKITNDAEDTSTNECRLALGAPYYGEAAYAITITPPANDKEGAALTLAHWQSDWKAKDGIEISVGAVTRYGNRTLELKNNSGYIANSGLVLCRNQDAPINGMFDTSKYYDKNTDVTTKDEKVYIVFLNSDGKDKVKAVP